MNDEPDPLEGVTPFEPSNIGEALRLLIEEIHAKGNNLPNLADIPPPRSSLSGPTSDDVVLKPSD